MHHEQDVFSLRQVPRYVDVGRCINCGRCAEVCPWGLRPADLFKWLERGEAAEARSQGLEACTECGCCAFVCPARIPLVQGLREGKRKGAA